jgi:hypothetical protein
MIYAFLSNKRAVVEMGWIKEALRRGELNITENNNCPFCNPEHRTDVPTNVNACKLHKWVSKKWFEEKFRNERDFLGER